MRVIAVLLSSSTLPVAIPVIVLGLLLDGGLTPPWIKTACCCWGGLTRPKPPDGVAASLGGVDLFCDTSRKSAKVLPVHIAMSKVNKWFSIYPLLVD